MKIYQIYQEVDLNIVEEMFLWMRDEERDLYKRAIELFAGDLKMRAIFITKKPVIEQIKWLHGRLKLNRYNSIGEHLCQAWLMGEHSPVLVAFCDGLELQHDGKGVVSGDLPEQFDESKLLTTVQLLFDKFPAYLVTIYLHVFNMQREQGWQQITDVLVNESKATLKK